MTGAEGEGVALSGGRGVLVQITVSCSRDGSAGAARSTGAERAVQYQDATDTVAPVKCQKICQGKHGIGWGWGWGAKNSKEEIAFNPHTETVHKLSTQEQTFKPSREGDKIK